jgi:hypothetical protein
MGSTTSQTIDRVFCSWKGSMTAVAASGTRITSDSAISWKPRMEEPSKPRPSVNASSSSAWIDRPRCCQVPGRSVNLKSTIRTPWARAKSSTSPGCTARPATYRRAVSGTRPSACPAKAMGACRRSTISGAKLSSAAITRSLPAHSGPSMSTTTPRKRAHQASSRTAHREPRLVWCRVRDPVSGRTAAKLPTSRVLAIAST